MTAVTPLLAFDVAKHEYRLHAPDTPASWGRVLPSVTQVIQAAGLVDGEEWFTEESRIRGRYVHKAVLYDETVGLDESSIDPALRGYIDAYRKFKRDVTLGPCDLIETPLADPVLGFAGTPDQVRTVDGRTALLDLKSGFRSAAHSLQTAAYVHLIGLHNGAWAALPRFVVYLAADGRYQIEENRDRRDWKVFTAALTLMQYRETRR